MKILIEAGMLHNAYVYYQVYANKGNIYLGYGKHNNNCCYIANVYILSESHCNLWV